MSSFKIQNTAPHEDITVSTRGSTNTPTHALVLLHGRFSNAEDMLGLADSLDVPDDCLVLAPTAAGNQWYPNRFVAPRSENQPHLDAALALVSEIADWLENEHGISSENTTLAGFSQGACLTAQFVATHPKQFNAVAVLSGGVIGTDKEVLETDWSGDLSGTPVYLGCDEADPHIALSRVEKTTEVMQKLNADVTKDMYKNFGHRVHQNGIDFLNECL